METLEREAAELLRILVAALRTGPTGFPEQFLAVPLIAGGGLLARPGAMPVHAVDLALVDALATRGYVDVDRTPHGFRIVTLTAAGLAAVAGCDGAPEVLSVA